MTRRKVLCIVGTRPEAIKMAPVIRELARRGEEFQPRVCATAQHREMLDQVLRLFDIRPDHDLNLMRENQTLAQITAAVFAGLDPVVRQESPEWILVQGDTTTVLAAGLIAFYHHIRLGHVEAGLRSGRKYQPFPEEINRRVVGVVADAHFAPTEQAKQNLLREGVPEESIYVTGNPVIDALHFVADKPFDIARSQLAGLPAQKRWVLVTAHRRENFGAALERICEALRELSQRYAGAVHWIYPVHMNPNVAGPVRRMLGRNEDVSLLPPLDYLPLIHLLKRCELVLTDSGGLQEEAPGLGKPVLVFREVTERPEGIRAGTVRLVGSDTARIVEETSRLLDDRTEYDRMAKAVQPYGDGRAARRIADILEETA
ncbi:MAG: UDP-N-acetylglucosamine 2-epimerase (non-hydrolyzing) [Anaerolineales bacterium]|nr:UDP-N-acetylglucosamine 2-epimerase (non-hydrolyzing) [Anaerolineales bacterium]